MAFVIPKPHKEVIAKLAAREPSELESLRETLSAASVVTDPEQFAEMLPSNPHFSDEDLKGIVSVLMSMVTTLYASEVPGTEDLHTFVKEVLRQVRGEKGAPKKEPLDAFAKFLEALIEIRPVQVSAKIGYLLTLHERDFRGAKIISDIRPIFDNADPSRILDYCIIHDLQITYSHSGEESAVTFGLAGC